MKKSQDSDTIEMLTVGQTILESLDGKEIHIVVGALATALQTLVVMHATDNEKGHFICDDIIRRFTLFRKEFSKVKGVIDQIPDGSVIQ